VNKLFKPTLTGIVISGDLRLVIQALVILKVMIHALFLMKFLVKHLMSVYITLDIIIGKLTGGLMERKSDFIRLITDKSLLLLRIYVLTILLTETE
jgi:hypothetical protein